MTFQLTPKEKKRLERQLKKSETASNKKTIDLIQWRLDLLERQIQHLCQEKDKLRNMLSKLQVEVLRGGTT